MTEVILAAPQNTTSSLDNSSTSHYLHWSFRNYHDFIWFVKTTLFYNVAQPLRVLYAVHWITLLIYPCLFLNIPMGILVQPGAWKQEKQTLVLLPKSPACRSPQHLSHSSQECWRAVSSSSFAFPFPNDKAIMMPMQSPRDLRASAPLCFSLEPPAFASISKSSKTSGSKACRVPSHRFGELHFTVCLKRQHDRKLKRYFKHENLTNFPSSSLSYKKKMQLMGKVCSANYGQVRFLTLSYFH